MGIALRRNNDDDDDVMDSVYEIHRCNTIARRYKIEGLAPIKSENIDLGAIWWFALLRSVIILIYIHELYINSFNAIRRILQTSLSALSPPSQSDISNL